MDPEPKITDKETMVEDNKEDGDELDDDSSHQVGEYRSKRRTVAVVETNSPSSADSNSLTPVTARKVGAAPVTAVVVCQAEKCGVDLSEAKKYRRRHKVCEAHFKAQAVVVAGIQQRFCQQCSRFHKLSEFDDTKKSCRRRLAGHNERRRKSSSESQGEG